MLLLNVSRIAKKIITPSTICFLLASSLLHAENHHLSDSEVSGIAVASLSLGAIGYQTIHFDTSRISIIKGPLPGEMSIQKFLGGSYYPGKTNWLDTDFGSVFIPAFMGTILLAADLSLNDDEKGTDVAQDIFLYGTGLLATGGITGIAKGFFARPRPYLAYESRHGMHGSESSYAKDHVSFFSSHTSTAFFASAFVNKRIRQIMRQEMSHDDYRNWQWAPPLFCFSWAAYVGWSRISSYKHYISDVIAGAAVGWLMAELFYSFGNDSDKSSQSNSDKTMLFHISISF